MATYLVLLACLCVGIQIFSGFADKLFLSIDCGGTANHTDRWGIDWVVDDGYIKTGEAAQVQNHGVYDSEINSLRYFSSQKKSCYVIPGVATGRKHMVRASFFYGNYDRKSSSPSFGLQFDGNHWVDVVTSSSQSYYREVIYAPKRNKISICVARTSPDQIPFISTLEIRELETGMYQTNGEEDVLLWTNRTAFGAKNFVRSFDFMVDGIKRNDDPIIPPYGTYVTDYNHGRDLTAGSKVSLVNTRDASLPPILNAMELFQLKTGLADGTSENDAPRSDLMIEIRSKTQYRSRIGRFQCRERAEIHGLGIRPPIRSLSQISNLHTMLCYGGRSRAMLVD
ncbi:uncharacterized protein At1g24485-like [Nymphaea colorata]|nr:uncharacterized protein At1g24485-like [Nymphaea colorata]